MSLKVVLMVIILVVLCMIYNFSMIFYMIKRSKYEGKNKNIININNVPTYFKISKALVTKWYLGLGYIIFIAIIELIIYFVM